MNILSAQAQTAETIRRNYSPDIVATIDSQGNHRVLIDELSKRRYKIIVSKDGKIHHVYIGKAHGTDGVRIPPELMDECQTRFIDGVRLSMNFAEIGGWCDPNDENKDFGIVVCGSKGQKLKPFHVTNHEEWGTAFEYSFNRGTHPVTVMSTCRELITIERHELAAKFEHEMVYVTTETLWFGKLKKLALEAKFAGAAKAAAEKALCQHCTRHLHFGEEPNGHRS